MKIAFTPTEDQNLLVYVAQRALIADAPLNMACLWREYKEFSGTDRSTGSLHERYRSVLSQKLHQNEHFDFATKVKMLFATFVPLNEQNMEMLRENAELLVVSERNVMLKYKNGNLELSAYDQDGKLAGNLQSGESRSKTKKRKWAEPEPIEPEPVKEEPEEPEDPNSLDFILKQLLKHVMPVEPEPEPNNNENLSVKNFLAHLKSIVVFLNTPIMDGVKMKVETALEVLENNGDQETTLSRIHLALESIFGLTFSCAADGNHEATTPLITFLGMFRLIATSYNHEELPELLRKIDRVVEKIADRNVEIPVTNIRLALENAFFLIYRGE